VQHVLNFLSVTADGKYETSALLGCYTA